MRVPAPAAKTTMAQSVVSATSFFVLAPLGDSVDLLGDLAGFRIDDVELAVVGQNQW